MTQIPFPELSSPVDASMTAEKKIGSPSPQGSSSSSPLQSYSVGGPHGPLRAQLLWVNRLLAYDENLSVSVISLRELRRALLAFQAEVRLIPPGQLGQAPAVAVSRSPSGIRQDYRYGRNIKRRTRNYKS